MNAEDIHMNENQLRATEDLRTSPCARGECAERCQEMSCHQKRSARGQDWPSGALA